MSLPNSHLEPALELDHVDRNKENVLRNVVKGAPKDGKPGAKSMHHTAHAAQQKSSPVSQRAAVLTREQQRNNRKVPEGPSMRHSIQPRRRVPASASANLCSALQPGGSNHSNKGVLAHTQNSGAVSRTVTGPKDRINSCRLKKEPNENESGSILIGSEITSHKPNMKTQPLQPPQLLTSSANLLHGRTGANQEETGTARAPIRKPPGKPPTVTDSKSSLKAGVFDQWQRPMVKVEEDRKEVKVPPQSTAASRVTVHQNQPHSTHSSNTQASESNLGSRINRLKPELRKASGMLPRCVPKAPPAADRRKQLEEWLASKGKTYKRPPMALLQKNPAKLSCRSVKQREKKENPEQLSLEKTNNILTECLKLTEEGVQAAKVLAVLSRLPQAEKFAKFWICKAKLLARSGPSDVDVMELYDAAVRAGAAPLEELRELVLDILKAADEKSEGEKAELPGPSDPTPCQSERQHVAATPCLTGRPPTGLPVSIKLRITPAYREKKLLECQKLKFLTPVRRSQRIEQNSSLYPEMLKDHDPLVASLREILDAEEGAQFIFQKNKALAEVELEDEILCCQKRC